MNKEVISDKQAVTLVTLFLLGSTLMIGTAGQAENDMWISILLGITMSIPVYFIYARTLSLFSGKGIFEILEQVFGKLGGKAIGLFYIWFCFHIGTLSLRNFGEFINVLALPETPMFIPMVMLIFICIWGVKLGIEVLGRLSESAAIVVFFLFITFTLLSISEMKIENIRPVLYNGIGPVLIGAFAAFGFPFAEVVIFLCLFDSLKSSKASYKIYFTGLLIGGLSILIVSIRNALILGPNQLDILYFSSYTAMSRISIGTFLQRLEVTVSMLFFICLFMKVCLCLLAASIGMARTFGLKDYRKIVMPIGLLMVNVAYFLYDSTMEMFDWTQKVGVYYKIPFQIVLPIIIWIICEIKSRKNSQTTDGICHSEQSEES